MLSSIGLNGSISVHALEGPKTGILPTRRSAKSPESYTVLDVDQNAYLFVGGMLGSVKVRDRTASSSDDTLYLLIFVFLSTNSRMDRGLLTEQLLKE